MHFSFTDEQQALRESARAFLADHSSSEQVRAAMASELGFDRGVWTRVAQEMGWTAITIGEEYGGLGLGYVELVALLEEMGAHLLCSPFFSSICLGANVLAVAANEEQKAEYLPGIAAGDAIATLALTEASGRWDASGIAATARRDGSSFVLDGVKTYVPDGHIADLLIVAARAPGSTGEAGVGLFAVSADADGLRRSALATMDQTRRQAKVMLTGVRVPGSALLGGAMDAWPSLAKALQLGAIALAAEQVGGADRCLAMAVQYATERVQFGRQIGSFQAIKHKCADMLLRVESARSAAYYAGWAASVDDAELPALASLAKSYCSDAYFHCAAESLQIHGGVGFTWEYDVHLHFKRARSGEQLLGSPSHHREHIAQQILHHRGTENAEK
jgi:alkylation response protein AidB-like acyl-CoA dehydrogenase